MKRNLLALSAIVLAVGFSAFTTASKTGAWYQYNGTQSQAERIKASNYSKVDAEPDCPGTTLECAVNLNQTTATPDFTSSKVTFDSNGYPVGGSTFISNDFLQ